MKKVLLFSAAALVSATSFAQVSVGNSSVGSHEAPSSAQSKPVSISSEYQQKSTALSDTLTFATDSMRSGNGFRIYYETTLPYDSGLVYGVNAMGYKGVARLYGTDINDAMPLDTTTNLLGWYARMGGRIQTNSTKQVTFSLWKRATSKTPVPNRPKFFVSNGVGVLAASRMVAANTLSTTTANFIYLPAPLTGINYDSYSGATFNYTWANTGTDTFGFLSTRPGSPGTSLNYYNLQSGTNDTLLNANVFLQNANGSWVSSVYDLGLGGVGDPIVAPLVRFNYPVSVKGYTGNDLTVFGAFPNPSNTQTNFKFALKSAAGVKTEFYDYSGRLISANDLGQLPAGEKIVTQDVAGLPSGMYIYVVSTSKGDVIATAIDVKH